MRWWSRDDRSTGETGPVNGRDEQARVVVRVDGRVQGVGFRWYVQRAANSMDLAGTATNLADGSVEVVAEGRRQDCERLVRLLDSDRPPGQVSQVAVTWDAPTGMRGFRTW
jgi:acylphosphatase